MTKNLLLACSLFAFTCKTSVSFSQNNNSGASHGKCGTGIPSQQWENQLQQLISERMANEANNKSQAAVFTIPVIVHVIHGGQAVGTGPNITQAQINSQIQSLNNSFGGNINRVSNYPNNAFSTYAGPSYANLSTSNKDGSGRIQIANCDIQFCLAGLDTTGATLAEPGIDRISYVAKSWTNPVSFTNPTTFQNYFDNTIKPQSIWNPNKYFNIWISDCSGALGLLGYATFPPLSTLTGLGSNFGTGTTDGIWCWCYAFGNSDISAGAYDNTYKYGGTAAHETGHWLGLRHVWGDGNCASDVCSDTPPASGLNQGTFVYPYKVNSCPNGQPAPNINGEMFMNYMDYTDDVGYYMFTMDQRTRMQTAMVNSPYRKFLGTHSLCSLAPMAPVANFNTFTTTACSGTTVNINNTTSGIPVPNYTWTTNPSAGVTINLGSQSSWPGIIFTNPGTYSITLTANNGTVSTITKTINVIASPNVSVSPASQTVCPNIPVTYTASGASTYSWSNGGGLIPTVTYTPASSSVYTVTGTGGGCSVTKTVAVTVNPAPVITVSSNTNIICAGDSVVLSATGSSSTYTWMPGGVTGNTVILYPSSTISYTATGTSSDGCEGSGTKSIFVNTCDIGIKEIYHVNKSYSIYPNPTSGKLNILYKNNKNTSVSAELSDVLGRVVLKQNLNYTTSENTNSISITGLPPGSYFLKLSTPDGDTAVIKVIKE